MPAILDAVAPTAVLAVRGIVTGRQLAAALALDAEGVWMGARFVASALRGTPMLLSSSVGN